MAADSTPTIEALAKDIEAAADATRIAHGLSAGDEAAWAEPARKIAEAFRSIDARLSALESMTVAKGKRK